MFTGPHFRRRSFVPTAVRWDGRGGFSLVEVMVALAIFIIGGLGVSAMIGPINNMATADRALTSAGVIVCAKIAKAQTDPWLPASIDPTKLNIPSGSNPTGVCPPGPGNKALKDATDPYDLYGVTVDTSNNILTEIDPLVVTSPDTTPDQAITGIMYQYVSTFEAAGGSKLITYKLDFVYRGKTYSVSQTTVRSPDRL